jgi:hypothetical protein
MWGQEQSKLFDQQNSMIFGGPGQWTHSKLNNISQQIANRYDSKQTVDLDYIVIVHN